MSAGGAGSTSDPLRSLVLRLSARVEELELRVHELESRLRVAEEQGFTLVTSSPRVSTGFSNPTSAAASTVPPGQEYPLPGPVRTPEETEWSHDRRAELADRLGLWLKEELKGIRQGPSGRSSCPLKSRIYVLVRSHSLQTRNPVVVSATVRGLYPHLAPGGRAADAIFIGLPTEWEARRAVKAAGLAWPHAA